MDGCNFKRYDENQLPEDICRSLGELSGLMEDETEDEEVTCGVNLFVTDEFVEYVMMYLNV